MSEHWSEYWSQGYLTSFGGEIKNNYEGILKKYWEKHFIKLDDDFNVLDLCTGNGSIPLLLEACLVKKVDRGTVVGVDMARVKELDCQLHSTIDIKLLSNINCQELPFEAETFNKCTSQFGVEYSNLEITIKEVTRVLKFDGEAHFIMHNTNSEVLKLNQRTLSIITNPAVDDLFFNISELINHMGEINSPLDLQKAKQNPVCEQYRKEVNKNINQIIKVDEEAAKQSELMMYIGDFFTKGIMWSINKKKEYLSFVINEISTQRLRLTELKSAAMDLEKIIMLLKKLPNEMSLISINQINEDSKVLAWEVTLKKNSK